MEAYLGRAVARDASDDAQSAVADYTQALRLKPECAQAYFNRGIARGQLQQLAGAVDDFERAKALDQALAEQIDPVLVELHRSAAPAHAAN